ncbi:hypothetical protein HGRIS_013538 [Hohenbuehelia grisea]|uniref:Uncharacterized protein n=1 Tax=Hohenbuehelia grisea TaxID=104357 RepID=A0ABR3IW35_9AGAR
MSATLPPPTMSSTLSLQSECYSSSGHFSEPSDSSASSVCSSDDDGTGAHHGHRSRGSSRTRPLQTRSEPLSKDFVLLLGLCLVMACLMILSIRPFAIHFVDG